MKPLPNISNGEKLKTQPLIKLGQQALSYEWR
jgi:hypothetical protein